jgi:hypoxanthine phosphoribosyltransferase
MVGSRLTIWKYVDMSERVTVLSEGEISQKIAQVAKQISADYRGEELIVIAILKGAFIFCADLVRKLDLERVKIDFLRAASYGSGTTSSEEVKLIKDIDIDIKGKHVLLVEDIVDTGLTLSYLVEHMRLRSPRSVRICAMIDKRERRKTDVDVDYVCHTVSEGFLVGYGLDFAEDYRNLPGLYHLKQ